MEEYEAANFPVERDYDAEPGPPNNSDYAVRDETKSWSMGPGPVTDLCDRAQLLCANIGLGPLRAIKRILDDDDEFVVLLNFWDRCDYILRIDCRTYGMNASRKFKDEVASQIYLGHQLPLPLVIAFDFGSINEIEKPYLVERMCDGRIPCPWYDKLSSASQVDVAAAVARFMKHVLSLNFARSGRIKASSEFPSSWQTLQRNDPSHGNLIYELSRKEVFETYFNRERYYIFEPIQQRHHTRSKDPEWLTNAIDVFFLNDSSWVNRPEPESYHVFFSDLLWEHIFFTKTDGQWEVTGICARRPIFVTKAVASSPVSWLWYERPEQQYLKRNRLDFDCWGWASDLRYVGEACDGRTMLHNLAGNPRRRGHHIRTVYDQIVSSGADPAQYYEDTYGIGLAERILFQYYFLSRNHHHIKTFHTTLKALMALKGVGYGELHSKRHILSQSGKPLSAYSTRIEKVLEELSWGRPVQINVIDAETVRLQLDSGFSVELYTPCAAALHISRLNGKVSDEGPLNAAGDLVQDAVARSLYLSKYLTVPAVYAYDRTVNNPLGRPYILFESGLTAQEAVDDIRQNGSLQNHLDFAASLAALQGKLSTVRHGDSGRIVASEGARKFNISPSERDVNPIIVPLDGSQKKKNLYGYLGTMIAYHASKPLNVSVGFVSKQGARVVHHEQTNKALLNLHTTLGEMANMARDEVLTGCYDIGDYALLFTSFGPSDVVVEKTDEGWVATAIKCISPSLFVPSELAKPEWSWLWDWNYIGSRYMREYRRPEAQIREALSEDQEKVKTEFQSLTRNFYPGLGGTQRENIRIIADIVVKDIASDAMCLEIGEAFKGSRSEHGSSSTTRIDYTEGFQGTEPCPALYWDRRRAPVACRL